MTDTPALPTRFPCWCRAIYSWGGEDKRDLGFIEGDLIECLNAGDGSWWTGRLRRDRRMVGMFPSNFVQVLGEDFRPVSQSISPKASRTPSPNPTLLQKTKSKPFRKPFQAYAAPDEAAIKRAEARQREEALARARQQPPNPARHTMSNGSRNNRHRTTSHAPRAASPQPMAYGSRQTSPQTMYDMRAPPPQPLAHDVRAPSPQPMRYDMRAPSPQPMGYGMRAPSPQPVGYDIRAPSPQPTSSYARGTHEGYIAREPSPHPGYGYDRAHSPHPEYARAHSPHPEYARAPSPHPTMGYGSRAPSPQPYVAYGSRSPSPLPHSYGRPHSPQPPVISYSARAPSPAPSVQYQPYRPHNQQPESRGPSPTPYGDIGSSPPPPPPPHRRLYAAPNSPHPGTQEVSHTPSRQASPAPPSPAVGNTPSPLRSAMEDVMSSLHDMGGMRETQTPEPLNPWSPEAFDEALSQRTKRQVRPSTAMGLVETQYDDRHEVEDEEYSQGSFQRPQLSNYVERMESRLRQMHESNADPVERSRHSFDDPPPIVPPKTQQQFAARPTSSAGRENQLRHRKSAYEIGRQVLGRTFTTKTSATTSSSGGKSTTTNTSSSSSATDRSLMSGYSAGGISATSAGSLQRRKEGHSRAHSAMGLRRDDSRPQTPISGVTYHSSHASEPRSKSSLGYHGDAADSSMLGGLVAPKPKKSSFFKKMFESAKTSAASARSSIAVSEADRSALAARIAMPPPVGSVRSSRASVHGAARDMGLGGGADWVQVRRDVNRSNSLSRIERIERRERCQMMDHPAISAVEELYATTDGDEGAEGTPVYEPINFQAVNYSMVDKNTRFVNSLPPMTNPVSLATGFVCRPYRSDVQRLRAIFTWVSEKINWEEDVDDSNPDARRAVQTKRGTPHDVAMLVREMCSAVGITVEVIRGYLKPPGEAPELGIVPRSNHWWNAVIIDGEWRIMDCSLASPSNPRRGQYSSAGQHADSWWFLARPIEMCWTHIPEYPPQQHLCPPVAHDILLALPCACPPYFKNQLELVDYDTSLTRIEDLEVVQVKFTVPADVECAAEVEARIFARDLDGDVFESGDTVKKRALTQAEWVGGQKRYTVKAVLPGDEGQGVLKIFAGKRGLMQSIKDIPHPLALALPIIHTGENPAYEFLTRHPTPHAQRHDLYVAQPQCYQLAMNNTFVFAVRQHPSSLVMASPNPGQTSPPPFKRPSSAMSMSASSNVSSNPSTFSSKKPAKLAIQTPGGKILRLIRKEERTSTSTSQTEPGDGGTWETIIKCGERGVWRGLVLADRTARWCVFAEWTCV